MAASDSLNREEKLNFAIGANVRYETGRKEQENRALSAEVALKGRTLTLAWTSTAFLAILLLAGGMYFRQRQRLQRRISEARLSRITSLLDTQGELDRRNRLLTQTLDERERELQEVTHRWEIGELNVKLSRHLSGPDEVQTSGRASNLFIRTICPPCGNIAPTLPARTS